MSILNVFGNPPGLLVFVDSRTDHIDGARSRASKLFPLVGQHACIAGRGDLWFISSVVLNANMCAAGDFSSLLDELPNIIELGYAEFQLQCHASASPNKARIQTTQEILLTGWDRGRVLGRYFKKTDQHSSLEQQDLVAANGAVTTMIAPYDAALGRHLPVRNIDDASSLAVAQTRLVNARFPDTGTGGQLIVADVQCGSISVRVVRDLPDDTEAANGR